jgi:hypothetical protein
MKMSFVRVSSIFLGLAVIIGCGGSNMTNPPPTVAGSYTAVKFVTTGSSGQTNQLLVGSTLSINLADNGATTGHLHMVASGGNPALEADMAGTWALSGTTVTFTQSADTFVRNMAFAVVANGDLTWSLVGDQVFSGTQIQLTLGHLTL